MSLASLNTPCVGICSTVYGDTLCRGCKRTYLEVIDWNRYSEETQNQIFHRLEEGQQKILIDKIEVTDPSLLESLLKRYGIRYRSSSPILCWAYHLIRCFPEDLLGYVWDDKQLGFKVFEDYQKLSPRALFTLMDEELLRLSEEKNHVHPI